MKEELRDIVLMGLGAMSLTSEKAKEIKEDLIQKGEEAYKNGKILNEELKYNLKEKIFSNEDSKTELTEEEVINYFQTLSEEEKKCFLQKLTEEKEETKK